MVEGRNTKKSVFAAAGLSDWETWHNQKSLSPAALQFKRNFPLTFTYCGFGGRDILHVIGIRLSFCPIVKLPSGSAGLRPVNEQRREFLSSMNLTNP